MVNSTPESLKKLAKEMNISEKELMLFASGVVNSIKQDGIVDTFINSSESDRVDISKAYAVNEGRKMEQFTTTYLTNTEAKQELRNSVLNSL